MNKGFVARIMMVMCSVVFSVWSMADEVEPSVQVTAKAWIGKQESKDIPVFAPTQQIILYVEVATNTWYTSGTHIASLEIPDVLVKQRNPFAINSSVRKQGQTWSTQLWEIVLYPQKSGEFSVPPVSVNVQVANEGSGKQQLTLETKPIAFRVKLPSAELDSSHQWFSSTTAQVTQDWQTSSDDLKVGDSVTREVEIQAQDSLSILLPSLMTNSTNQAWQSYMNSPQLTDSQSREGYISKRKDSVTYILQQGGDISWPSYDVWWWNTKKQSLERITIDGYRVNVRHTFSSWVRAYQFELFCLLVSMITFAVVFYSTRRYFQTHSKPAWYVFTQTLLHRRWSQSRALIYKKTRVQSQRLSLIGSERNSKFNKVAYDLQMGGAKRSDFVWVWRRLKKRNKVCMKIPKALKDLDELKR